MHDARARILIVDDDTSIRISLSLIFSALGYAVRSCVDGLSAISEIRTEIPDVLLADLNMARLPGLEFLGMVRRWFPSIRIIAMTGAFTLNSDPLRGAADAFYQKGAGPLHLIESVRAMTQLKRPTMNMSPENVLGSRLLEGIPPHSGAVQLIHSSDRSLALRLPRNEQPSETFPAVGGIQTQEVCVL